MKILYMVVFILVICMVLPVITMFGLKLEAQKIEIGVLHFPPFYVVEEAQKLSGKVDSTGLSS